MSLSNLTHRQPEVTGMHEKDQGQVAPRVPFRTKLCRNYPLGTCRYGEHCTFLHTQPVYSPATQYAPTVSVLPRTMYPLNSSLSTPSPSSIARWPPAPYRTPNEHEPRPPQTNRDPRIHAPRADGPRRFAGIAPGLTAPGEGAPEHVNARSGSNVEQWRLSVIGSREGGGSPFPPPPPGTPVSFVHHAQPHATSPTAGAVRSGSVPDDARTGEVPGRARWESGGESCQMHPSPPPRAVQMARQSRHRNQYFRTKPCRFHAEPGGCVKGDRCNFIHEYSGEGGRANDLSLDPPPEILSEGEAESGAESSVQGESPSTVATSDHTPSVITQSDQKKSNFYPVTWRVVSGGVTMGGRREVCENFMAGHCPEGADCRYAHPDTSDEEYLANYVERSSIYSPISPILSPVVFAYPVVYPTLSPPQPFALPAAPSLVPVPSQHPGPIRRPQPTKKRSAHRTRPMVTVTPISPVHTSTYSPHRVVDGSTLAEKEPAARDMTDGGLLAARSVVRPVSTPPTPVQGPEAGVARLFAAEMP